MMEEKQTAMKERFLSYAVENRRHEEILMTRVVRYASEPGPVGAYMSDMDDK